MIERCRCGRTLSSQERAAYRSCCEECYADAVRLKSPDSKPILGVLGARRSRSASDRHHKKDKPLSE